VDIGSRHGDNSRRRTIGFQIGPTFPAEHRAGFARKRKNTNPSQPIPFRHSLTYSPHTPPSHQYHTYTRDITLSQWVSLTSFPRLVSTVSSSAPPSLRRHIVRQAAHRCASTVVADGWLSPQQLGLHPQLHRRVRLRHLFHFLRLPHPPHRFPDEQFWSVFLRRLKTPLNEDKPIRVLRTSDLSISALTLRYSHCISLATSN